MAKNTRTKTKINLITPPDILHNIHKSFFLVYPSSDVKQQFQNLIENFNETINVYLYEQEDQTSELSWLIRITEKSNFVVLDIDNFPPQHSDIISFLIAHSNVYWLTKGENQVYNSISNNRIYNLDWLYEKIIGEQNAVR
jgi:hypothetical protein